MRYLLILSLFLCSPVWAQASLKAKPGKGIQLQTEDNQFLLNVRPRAQLRYTLDLDNTEDALSTTQSLQFRRARLAMTGHMFGENNYFKMELAFSPRDLGFKNGVPTRTPLLDFYTEFRYLRDFTLRAGQYKVPFNRQRVISSGNLQLVDRTIANAEFNVDRDIGFDLRSKDLLGLNLFRYYAGVYIGKGRDAFQQAELSTMMLGRVEVLPLGMCDDYKEGDLEISSNPCLSMGLAYAFLPKADRNKGIIGKVPEDLGTSTIHVGNADTVFKWHGLSIFSEIYARYGIRNVNSLELTEQARNGVGGTLQAGQAFKWAELNSVLEFAGRYSFVRSSNFLGIDTSMSNLNELGVGTSLYLGGHSLKIQGDVFRTWEDSNPIASHLGQTTFRTQLQAAF